MSKISELTGAAALAGTEELPIVQSGATVKTTVQDIADLAEFDYSEVMRVVNHGSTASTARPSPAGAVYWIGDVEPDNGVDGDLWFEEEGS